MMEKNPVMNTEIDPASEYAKRRLSYFADSLPTCIKAANVPTVVPIAIEMIARTKNAP